MFSANRGLTQTWQYLSTPRLSNYQDAKQHLERLVELLQTPKTAGGGSRGRSARRSLNSTPPGDLGALAMALGNLGVVCHELGEADRASEMLEASLKSASFVAAGVARHVTTVAALVESRRLEIKPFATTAHRNKNKRCCVWVRTWHRSSKQLSKDAP